MHAPTTSPRSGSGIVLLTLAAGQFVMALDSSVMNVSIATVAKDVGTTVTGVQGAITAYTLVMAALMIPGSKIGAIIGPRRAFRIGAVIYGVGSVTTALAPSLPVLLIGWSLLEGIGAALIMPAVVALVAANVERSERAAAYGAIAAAGAIAVAVGPVLGGIATTSFSWRWVFVGEVVLLAFVLLLARRIVEAPRDGAPSLDWVGSGLTALGLATIVLGVLRSSEWGWVTPRPAGASIAGFSPVPWMIFGGLLLLWASLEWAGRRQARDLDPLLDPDLLANDQLRRSLAMFFVQFMVQAGTFFVLPLYLSVALGLSALETGLRILPLSASLLASAVLIPRLWPAASPQRVARVGVLAMATGVLVLLGAIDADAGPEIVTAPLLLLGLGIGALASQLGAVAVSAVPDARSPEVGGLQNTVTNLGASIGTALAGSVLIAALTASFLAGVQRNPDVPASVAQSAEVRLAAGAPFLSDADLERALANAGASPTLTTAVIDSNTAARLDGLRAALTILALLAIGGLFVSRGLPTEPIGHAAREPGGQPVDA